MAEPIQQETVTEEDLRHFDFIDTLRKISNGLSKRETAILKLYCYRIIPRGQLEKMKRPIDIFLGLEKLAKLNSENLDFVEELLARIPRPDLIRDVLRPFQPSDRELPENPELLPGPSSATSSTEEGSVRFTVHGHTRMVEETKNRYRTNLARIGRTKKSSIRYKGYKKHGSILVEFVVPLETLDLLRLMARHSDPRLVFMGVTSLQIGREDPVDVPERTMLYDIQNEFAASSWLPQDDIHVGCRASPPRKPIPHFWSSLSALNLFSDALPLHLQLAESLEYQGFSYSLVQALVQKDQVREHQMRQVVKTKEVDYHTMMTMRSKLTIAENRAKTLEDENDSLQRLLEQAQEEKLKLEEAAVGLVEYTGEKYTGEKPSADSEKKEAEPTAESPEEPTEAAALGQTEDSSSDESIKFGGQGSEPGKFAAPRGVIVSPDNEIFIADMKNNRVQVHNIRGDHLLLFPTVVSGGGTIRPQDIAMDNSGHLWVVGRDKSSDFLVQYTREGQVLQEVSLRDIGYRYRGVAVNKRNNEVLVAESDTTRAEILVFRSDGSLARRFGHVGVLGRATRWFTGRVRMEDPGFITVNEEGNILISDWDAACIFVYDQTGRLLFNFGGLGSGEGQLRWPCGICTDFSGNIIVADFGNGRLEQFTSRGEHLRHIDIAKRYGSPDGVALGPMGHLVVTYVEKNAIAVFPDY
ncbi:TRIM3 [Branchiostoma lanceolatum]|uniref:TRIM3 protein n=1 Tax=Branchiostoma lanceolatum TaxID=7740 RepID=A0A8J9Z0Q9_BRALA|nr:TRIM3 [Branchiostoma lanceolatum]